MRLRSSSEKSPIALKNKPYCELGPDGIPRISQWHYSKRTRGDKPSAPEKGFYDTFSKIYYEYYLPEFRSSTRVPQRGADFQERTKIFITVVNFLCHGEQIISDYSSIEARTALLQTPAFSSKKDKEALFSEKRLYISQNYFERVQNYDGPAKRKRKPPLKKNKSASKRMKKSNSSSKNKVVTNLLKRVFNSLKSFSEAIHSKESMKTSLEERLFDSLRKHDFKSFLASFKENAVKANDSTSRTVNIEHVVAKAQGGDSSMKNAAVISRKINGIKSDGTPGTGMRTLPKGDLREIPTPRKLFP